MFKIKFVLLLLFGIAVVASQVDFENDADAADSTTTVAAEDGTTEVGENCEDAIPDCIKYAYECENDKYKPLMCGMCKVRKKIEI